jgi:hypothetical protein
MAEYLDQLLESLGTTGESEPPAAFLRAVGRRRRSRRLAQAGAGLAMLALLVAGGVLVNSALTRPSGSVQLAAAPSLPVDSMLALVRTNAHLEAEHLVLPDRVAPADSEPLRLGLHWNPSEVDRWVGQ